MMSPVFDEFSDKYAGKCVFVKVDVDKSEVRQHPSTLAHAQPQGCHGSIDMPRASCRAVCPQACNDIASNGVYVADTGLAWRWSAMQWADLPPRCYTIEAVAHADSTHFVCHSELTSGFDTH